MSIENVLRLLVVAIVLLVAFWLLGLLLKIGAALLSLGVKLLVILLLVAIVLRFIDLVRNKRR